MKSNQTKIDLFFFLVGKINQCMLLSPFLVYRSDFQYFFSLILSNERINMWIYKNKKNNNFLWFSFFFISKERIRPHTHKRRLFCTIWIVYTNNYLEINQIHHVGSFFLRIISTILWGSTVCCTKHWTSTSTSIYWMIILVRDHSNIT